jgi:hypothetical protein
MARGRVGWLEARIYQHTAVASAVLFQENTNNARDIPITCSLASPAVSLHHLAFWHDRTSSPAKESV